MRFSLSSPHSRSATHALYILIGGLIIITVITHIITHSSYSPFPRLLTPSDFSISEFVLLHPAHPASHSPNSSSWLPCPSKFPLLQPQFLIFVFFYTPPTY